MLGRKRTSDAEGKVRVSYAGIINESGVEICRKDQR